jgi:hypothetical protein
MAIVFPASGFFATLPVFAALREMAKDHVSSSFFWRSFTDSTDFRIWHDERPGCLGKGLTSFETGSAVSTPERELKPICVKAHALRTLSCRR